MKFEYTVVLEDGFTPTMQDEKETEFSFVIEAKNFVTANRMVAAMFKGASNVKECDGICIEQ